MAEVPQPRNHITDCIDGVEWDYYPVTAEANTLVLQGDRQAQYGHPLPWAVRFANCLNAVFGWGVTPEQVPLLMILFKVCRQVGGKRHRDNMVDVCGYAECAQRVCEAESKLEEAEGRKGQGQLS